MTKRQRLHSLLHSCRYGFSDLWMKEWFNVLNKSVVIKINQFRLSGLNDKAKNSKSTKFVIQKPINNYLIDHKSRVAPLFQTFFLMSRHWIGHTSVLDTT